MESEERYSAHGHVTITDADTGEVLADKDNMIVLTGRQLIAGAVFKETALKIGNFSMFFESDDSAETVPDMTYAGISSHVKDDVSSAFDSATMHAVETEESLPGNDYLKANASSKVLLYCVTGDGNRIRLFHALKTANNYYVTALGLTYKDASDANASNILFSRVMFDPVYMRATRTYVVRYVVKF